MEKITTSRFPGERVKSERLRLGFKSQAQAAKTFGVERETWSRYETNKLEMGQEVFRRFVEAGADPDYIVTGHTRAEFEKIDAGHLPAHMQNGAAGREAALLRHYRSLPEPMQNILEDTAENFATLVRLM